MPVLLVVDDEPGILYSLAKSLRADNLQVITVATGREAIEHVRRELTDAVLLDVLLSDMSGLDAYDSIHQLAPRLPVIFMTANATTETAIEAMKRGAFEYLLKPLDVHQLREVVAQALALNRQPVADADSRKTDAATKGHNQQLIGRSAAMQSVYKAIGRVAPLDVPVLILGESGTGKEVVAQAIYQHSHRSDAPFLTINCAALPESLLESELFGHEKGAFTSADRRRIGKFEQANHGTILLDEIGDMSPSTQPKILRLLQQQQFERLGSNETIQTDVRVIAATNQNLEELVAAGRLRQDLFYRLKVFTIQLPPLRERLEDIPLLAERFLKDCNDLLGKCVRALAPKTLELLQAHNWPGNVRELQSTLKYAVVQARGDLITPDCLPGSLSSLNTPDRSSLQTPQPVRESCILPIDKMPPRLEIGDFVDSLLQSGEPEIYRRVSAAVERVVLNTVLRHVKGNQVQASELLGISRTTLRSKLRSLGLTIEKHILAEVDQAD